MACYFVAIGLSAGVAALLRLETRRDGLVAGLGGLVVLAFVMAAPILAYFLAANLASRLL